MILRTLACNTKREDERGLRRPSTGRAQPSEIAGASRLGRSARRTHAVVPPVARATASTEGTWNRERVATEHNARCLLQCQICPQDTFTGLHLERGAVRIYTKHFTEEKTIT